MPSPTGRLGAAVTGCVDSWSENQMDGAPIDMRPVRPCVPAAGYVGGKKQLAAAVIARIEQISHVTYAEAFVGMGGVFLRRRSAPKSEVINDLAGDVATFFRILQRHYVPFMEMLKWQLTSRREFERLAATDPATLTDLERAARFLYLQRTAFGGKVAGRSFGVTPSEGGRFDVRRLGPVLEAIHERLAGVVVEALPWEPFLDRYDRPGTLFFLDPPYDRSEHYYGRGLFAPEEHERLADRLGSLKGSFVLTINDTPRMRAAFAAFDIEEVGLTYTLSGGTKTAARELIITAPRRG